MYLRLRSESPIPTEFDSTYTNAMTCGADAALQDNHASSCLDCLMWWSSNMEMSIMLPWLEQFLILTIDLLVACLYRIREETDGSNIHAMMKVEKRSSIKRRTAKL